MRLSSLTKFFLHTYIKKKEVRLVIVSKEPGPTKGCPLVAFVHLKISKITQTAQGMILPFLHPISPKAMAVLFFRINSFFPPLRQKVLPTALSCCLIGYMESIVPWAAKCPNTFFFNVCFVDVCFFFFLV